MSTISYPKKCSFPLIMMIEYNPLTLPNILHFKGTRIMRYLKFINLPIEQKKDEQTPKNA